MFRRALPLLFVVCFVVLLGGCNVLPGFFGIKGTLNVNVSFVDAKTQLEKVEIFVDGKFRGNINPKEGHVYFDLTAGEHLLVIKCAGFDPYRRMIHVGSGPTNLSVYVELKKQPQEQ